MSKLTAVQWLIEQKTKFHLIINDDLEKALAMEKEQIIDAWKNGVKTDYAHSGTFELFYTETYGK